MNSNNRIWIQKYSRYKQMLASEGAGVLNVNALLPVTAPLLLNAELAFRQIGIYAFPYLNNYR